MSFRSDTLRILREIRAKQREDLRSVRKKHGKFAALPPYSPYNLAFEGRKPIGIIDPRQPFRDGGNVVRRDYTLDELIALGRWLSARANNYDGTYTEVPLSRPLLASSQN